MTAMSIPVSDCAAIVIGASGGIGGALANALDARGFGIVHRLSRSGPTAIDLTGAASVRDAIANVLDGPPVTTAILATGLLHRGSRQPEKSMKAIDPDWMAEQFAVNAIGPALVLSYLLPRLPRDRPVHVAALGARVGSIADNRLGGWYGYRASKAALHQIIRTAAIEWARSHAQGTLVALHPGTVTTALSAPFARLNAPATLLQPAQSAAALVTVLHGLTPVESGRIFDWQGREIAP